MKLYPPTPNYQVMRHDDGCKSLIEGKCFGRQLSQATSNTNLEPNLHANVIFKNRTVRYAWQVLST